MDIYTRLLSEFTTTEQLQFLEKFKLYINHDPRKDFVIDIEKCFKYIGFTRKDNAKRLLVKFFNLGEDYLLLPKEEQELFQHGGNNMERILLSPNTFKSLCLLANTAKSREIRDYYIKMEEIVMQAIIEQKDLVDVENKKKIKALEKELAKFQVRAKTNYEYGNAVYIIMEYNEDTECYVFKVGSTNKLSERKDSYICHTTNAKMVYTKMCKNRKVLEDVIHQMFKDHRFQQRHDWFVDVDFYDIKDAIDLQQRIMDGEESPSTFDEKTVGPRKNASKFQNIPVNILAKTTEGEETTVEDQKPQSKDNTCWIDKFLHECFNLNPKAKTAWIDISARYRLWARDTTDKKEEIEDLLKSRGFKRAFTFDDVTMCNVSAYEGLEILPIPPLTVTPSSSEFDHFVYETMVTSITGRISIMEVCELYTKWKTVKDASYIRMLKSDRDDLVKYFTEHFLSGKVHTGMRIRQGFFGICAKGKENIGKKAKPGNRKAVNMLDGATRTLVQTFDSISIAAHHVNGTIQNLSNAIKLERKYKNFYFIFAITDEKEQQH